MTHMFGIRIMGLFTFQKPFAKIDFAFCNTLSQIKLPFTTCSFKEQQSAEKQSRKVATSLVPWAPWQTQTFKLYRFNLEDKEEQTLEQYSTYQIVNGTEPAYGSFLDSEGWN